MCVLFFFLDDLRDGVDEKDFGAGIKRSVPSGAVEVVQQCDLLPGVHEPQQYKHRASVRCFHEEPAPTFRALIYAHLFVSGNLPYFQSAHNLRSLNLIQTDVPVVIQEDDKLPTWNEVSVHEIALRFEQVQRQITWTRFGPTDVHPGARYDQILEFCFRWGLSWWDGNLEGSSLVQPNLVLVRYPLQLLASLEYDNISHAEK